MVSVSQIMQSLGIENPLPLVGFVFAAGLAKDGRGLMQSFSGAVQKGQSILAASDQEWERIRPLMKAGSDEEYRMLRARYREGLLRSWNERDREAARKLFAIVSEIGGEEVTGTGVTFDPRAFWDGFVL
jgi:NitT/TauT family transport system substrate-binding protein